jgi:site-specific DNA-methyltransferase (adenine-specific)/modification methylase
MLRKEVIGDATLYLGDCLEILPTLPKVDAVITDPPYGIGIGRAVNRGKGNKSAPTVYAESAWDDERLSDAGLEAVLGAGKWVCLWGGNYFPVRPQRTWLVWDKMLRGQDMADCELAWTNFTGKGVRIIRHLWAGFFRDGDDPRGVHPAQKPEAVMAWCIKQAPAADSVLDPFMGSGTTGVACAQLGRKFIGIEREPKYFEIACKRIEQAYKQRPLFEAEPAPQPVQMGIEA